MFFYKIFLRLKIVFKELNDLIETDLYKSVITYDKYIIYHKNLLVIKTILLKKYLEEMIYNGNIFRTNS